MDDNMMTRESAGVLHFLRTLDRLLRRVERVLKSNRPTLSGERYLTDREVSERLKISRRTLQDYRTMGYVSYYQLGGKILYRESDIQRMLDENYRRSFGRDY